MTNEKKMELLEETFDVDSGVLSMDTVLEDLDEWDSMTKLSLIVVFSDEFNKKITSEEIKKFVTVKDIIDFM